MGVVAEDGVSGVGVAGCSGEPGASGVAGAGAGACGRPRPRFAICARSWTGLGRGGVGVLWLLGKVGTKAASCVVAGNRRQVRVPAGASGFRRAQSVLR